MHTRRNFIKQAGLGAAGFGLLPDFSRLLEGGAGGWAVAVGASLPRATPESQGVSSEGIRKFIAAANAAGTSWHSFMLVRHGHVIAEGWWEPFKPEYVHTLYSLSKSFTSTAIGLLVKEGKLDIQKPLIDFFPDEKPAEVSEHLRLMTIRRLLTMNTGHAEDSMGKMRGSGEPWTKTYLSLPVQYTPGTHFLYNTGNTYMLGAVVHKITGQTLTEYLGPRLFQPLDITGYDWETSPQGLNTGGYGLRVKTEDIAKFGQLYLQKGSWNGKELLPAAWVQEATSKQTTSQEGNGDWSVGYGYQFWRCKPGFYRGDGANGQYCIVMQDLDAVMVVTEQTGDMQGSMNIIWDTIPGAMQASVLGENVVAQVALRKDLAGLRLAIPKGSVTSPLAAKYNDKTFTLDPNDFGATKTKFTFSTSGCEWVTMVGGKETAIRFGWESWVTNKESSLYTFPEWKGVPAPSKLAGTATWMGDNTLQLNARFVQGMLGDTITCVFNGEEVSISFLNSLAEQAKDPKAAEGRKGLVGKLAG